MLLEPNLSQQEDERSKVEDINHSNKPVQEHGGARGRFKTQLSVFQGGIEHLLQDVETNAQLI